MQNFAEQGPFLLAAGRGLQTISELGAHPVKPVLVDGGIAWHIHLFDRLAHSPLHAAQETALPRGEKKYCVSAAASSTGAANPVHVGLRIEGNVVVNHQADAIHIETAGSHIGGN